jgi:hypothetical protein
MRLQRIVPAVCCLLLLTAAGLNAAAQDDPQINAWITYVKDRAVDVEKRVAAIDGLGKAGPKAQAAVPALLEALADPDAMVRSAAAFSLGFIHSDAPAVVPALTRALADTDKFVRSAAANGLEFFGPQARDAVPELTRALDDAFAPTRSAAARALTMVGPDAKRAAAKLIGLLADADKYTRSAAALALGAVGAAADEAVPALARVVGDEYVGVRRSAALALGRYATPASMQALKKMMADADAGVRQNAQISLDRVSRALASIARPTTPPKEPTPRPSPRAVTGVDFLEARTSPAPGGFTYHVQMRVPAAGPGEKFTFYCAFRHDRPPDYPVVKRIDGPELMDKVHEFQSKTAGEQHLVVLKIDVFGDQFGRIAALEPGENRIRAYVGVYLEGKRAYLTGPDAWNAGVTFIAVKAADATVRVRLPDGNGPAPQPPAPPVSPPVTPPTAPPVVTAPVTPRPQQPEGWRPFAPAGGGFTVLVPGTPTETRVGEEMHYEVSLVPRDADLKFGYVDLAADEFGKTPDEIIAAIVKEYDAERTSMKLLGEKQLELDSLHPGLEYLLQGQAGKEGEFIRLRLNAAGVTRVYLLAVVGLSREAVQVAQPERFFCSFGLTPR